MIAGKVIGRVASLSVNAAETSLNRASGVWLSKENAAIEGALAG